MKILIVKETSIKISESFIIGHSTTDLYESMLIHKQVPVEFGKAQSKRYIYYSKILNQIGKLIGDPTYTYKTLLKRIITKFKPDVMLAEYGVTGVQVFELCKQLKIPLVIHFHGFDAHMTNVLAKYQLAYRRMFHVASAIISVSDAMTTNLINAGASQEKLFLNPYGIDLRRFSKTNETGDYFLAVGRFVEKKAPNLTVKAFSQALQITPHIKLIMIGDGELLAECKTLAEELGSADHIKFLGALEHNQVRKYMENAYAFIQHSVVSSDGDSEGSPVAITEAGAMQLPVISTRHAGIPRIVIDNVTGILVEERDVDGMASAIAKLAKDNKLALKMGQAARQHIEKNFSKELSMERLRDIFSWVITKKNKPAANPPMALIDEVK
ncbi:glycosyltransferase [Parapedobacter sp. ISTM3]|uniref:glycosyltransferase n=1 Tax=Parapedobacter sp. ISTM3 TaxID=2800130 RepID=UPI0019049CB9|nr:glycosyltransferase [Parapedobacter sp. ISTM3]MBK1441652.1 glycosyltransferase [Parapedobacter sp. ISTM3]